MAARCAKGGGGGGDPPDPPPLAVWIDRPTEVQPGQAFTWTAMVSGGEGPYTYQWYPIMSTDPEVFAIIAQSPGPAVSLMVEVQSSDGQMVDDFIEITPTYAAPDCTLQQ